MPMSLVNLHLSLDGLFSKLSFKPNLQNGIEEKFSDMLAKYDGNDQPQKFAKFMTDYFISRGCDVKIKISD